MSTCSETALISADVNPALAKLVTPVGLAELFVYLLESLAFLEMVELNCETFHTLHCCLAYQTWSLNCQVSRDLLLSIHSSHTHFFKSSGILQYWQPNGLNFRWTPSMWIFKHCLVWKDALHSSHLNFLDIFLKSFFVLDFSSLEFVSVLISFKV